MKTEIRTAIMTSAVSKIGAIFGENAVPVRVGKKNMIAVESGEHDEKGRPIFYTIDITVKDNEGTKTHEGFDVAKAVQERIDYDNEVAEKASAPKATKAKTADPVVEARKQARMDAIANWLENAEPGREYTATEVFSEVGEVMGSVMLTGTTLQKFVPDKLSIVTHDGKKFYVVE